MYNRQVQEIQNKFVNLWT